MATTSCVFDSRDGESRPPGPDLILCRALTRTEAFRAFQRSVGDATLHLNTVAVGLEAISSDLNAAQKAAASLNVGWHPPGDSKKSQKNTLAGEPLAKRVVLPHELQEMRNLTSRSKIFVLRAVLVAACDSLDAYAGELVRTTWLKFDSHVVNICTKAVTKPNNIAWSLAERYRTLCQALGIGELEGHCAIIGLASRWRNALVHAENAEFVFDKNDKQVLLEHADKLTKAGFVIDQAIDRFEKKSSPTLKDVTTVISYSQDLCKAIDRKAIQNVASLDNEVESLLKERLRNHFKSRGRVDDFWGIYRDQEWDMKLSAKVANPDRSERVSGDTKWNSRFGSLLDALGFSATKHAVSATISHKEIGRLSSMSAKQFADELGLPI